MIRIFKSYITLMEFSISCSSIIHLPPLPPASLMLRGCRVKLLHLNCKLFQYSRSSLLLNDFFFFFWGLSRHLRLSADLNNMSWRIRPEELLLEVGKPFSSKMNLHQAMSDINVSVTMSFVVFITNLSAQFLKLSKAPSFHLSWHIIELWA